MSDLLSLATTGIRGYSRALQTIGDNIANAQTPGYARRSTLLAEQVSGGHSVLYPNQVAPGGVLVTGVTRVVDPWLIEDARVASGDAAQTGARLAGLEAVEAAIHDGGAGVGRAMTALFNRADELATEPASNVRRGAFLQATSDVADAFRRTADGFTRAADGVATRAASGVAQLNTDLGALSRVNNGLRRAREGSTNQASLLDDRDRLLDSISAALPVGVAYDARGAVTLDSDGAPLLAGGDAATVSLAVAADGRLSLGSIIAGSISAINPASGALAGHFEAAGAIATQRSALDGMASNFVTTVNAQHVAGRDATGAQGRPLLVIGTGAADMTALALTATEVAAADASASNGNALAFGNLRGAGGGEMSWADFAARHSQMVAGTRAQDSAATSRRDGAANARDAVASIDLDREAADLVRFQQAYQASARVLQTARETLQTIMDAL